MVRIRANQRDTQDLPIFEWWPAGGEDTQWGLVLQTVGTSLTEEEEEAVLRAFCGQRHMYVLSTRYEEPSFTGARQAKLLVESGFAGSPLDVHEPSPCYKSE